MNVLRRRPRPNAGDPDPVVARAQELAAILSDAAAEADAAASIADDVWAALHRSALPMAVLPIEQGGEGLSAPARCEDLLAVLRTIGAADLSIGRLFEGHVNGVALVCRFGTPGQVAALADAVRAGALTGVWGADDTVALRAEQDGATWRLTGGKTLASGAGVVTQPVVTARSEAGQIMLLPRLRPGERSDLSGWTAQGMRSTATGRVDLTGLVLSADQVLGQPGDFMRQPHFSGGAWRFCAVHLGAAERLVDLLRDHLVSRGRGEDPYQLQRVAHCVAAVGGAAFWIEAAARHLAEESLDADAAVAFVNLTRTVTERAALDVLEAVHRGIGLTGFLRPHPVERVARDLATYLRQPVPDLAMADAARAVLASARPTAQLWTGS